MSKEAMKLALETAEGILNADWRKWDELASPAEFERWAKSRAYFMATILREALAQPEQEPVADALHFAHWTTDKKDLSDYILVGSLTLAGIEDGEYGTSEIDPLDNTIDALQERIVTGSDHKKVPLLAYIGALKPTPPQQEQKLIGTVGELFDDKVIAHRKLDRDLLVYIKENT